MLQENNIVNTTSTTSATSATSFTLSSQSSSTPSSPSSFTHEYDTSNHFYRLPNETIFTILAFAITNQTTDPVTPHKQLCILSQVSRLFNKISNGLWQIAFETKFDSEAVIRAKIIDNSIIGEKYIDNVFGDAGKGEGEDEGNKATTQLQSSSSFVQMQTSRNVWKELYKERQIVLNKIKNYIKPTTLPSPTVYNNNNNNNNHYDINNSESSDMDNLDDFFMEFESDHNNDITTNNSSTLDSTDQVDDDVDYQLFDFDFNFVGNERTGETERNNLDFTLEDDEEFRFQELYDENNSTFTVGDAIKDTVKEDTVKEDTAKEDDVKDTIKEDTLKEDTLKEDSVKEEPLKEKENLNLKDNFEFIDSLTINEDVYTKDLDFVSEDLIKFDDPELNSVFDSDAIKTNKFVDDIQDSVVENMENIIEYSEVLLVKDIDNSAKEVDHIAQAQDSSNPEINDDLNVNYLHDYDESFKLLDYGEESFKLPDDEESSSKLRNFDEEPRLQDYEESSTILQNFNQDEPKLQSCKSPDNYYSTLKDDLPDYDENEEVSQLQDHSDNKITTNLQDYNENNENEEISQLQDFEDIQVENSLKENFDNDEITNLPSYDENEVKTNNIITENDLLDVEDDLFNENTENTMNIIINEKEQDDVKENDDVSENNDLLDDNTNGVENSQLNYNEEEQDYEIEIDHEDHEDNNEVLTQKKIDNDPELLKILNVIWKICQENDGMNSEVLLEYDVKELVVSIIQSLDKMEIRTEQISISLQVLSLLVSWHPELTIDFQNKPRFWRNIQIISQHWPSGLNYLVFYNDSFSRSLLLEDSKQLALPVSAGSAIHIFYHTGLFNLPNLSEFINNYVPPPQLIPDSSIFKDGVFQPFEQDLLKGKWCGYYTTDLSNDSQMEITLDFSPPEPGKVYYLNRVYEDERNHIRVNDKVVKELSGNGFDRIGEFVIRHGIITEKGNINFTKTYIGKHSWIYDGILLPVGICGRWGTSYEWSGNFWIWKK